MSSIFSCRRAGVLLHPTSLPSGCIDGEAERFLDFMQACGLRVWQMLPVGIPDHTGSPYQSCSAFAADPGLLGPGADAAADSISLGRFREPLRRFLSLKSRAVDPVGLARFREQQSYWLEDFACFRVMQRAFDGAPWYEWPVALRDRDPDALADFVTQHEQSISDEIAQQFRLEQRWQALRKAAAERDIVLFGDLPIFVALDSADVWANRDQFLLDENGRPTMVAGVPPDYFSETGQRWGNPHYDWEHMRSDNFAWWHARMRRQLEWFDMVRVDHFRGLAACWMIPAESETAIEGHWQEVPGESLLHSLHDEFENLPIVAEDLGVITPDVEALRRQFALPGMSVLQFSFDAFEDNPHKPHNIGNDRVVYTGTHDNDTTLGWYQALDEGTQAHVLQVLDCEQGEDVVSAMIRTALATDAALAVFPMQDLLGLDSGARMNTPGKTEGNWNWRFDWPLVEGAADRLAKVTDAINKTGRSDDC